MPEPRYIQQVPTDSAGLRDAASLPFTLPFELQPRDLFRLVEDLHDLLHQVNTLLTSRRYERLEELMDSAAFSGLLSRAVVDGIHRQSRALDRNEYHNGYPDLLPHGVYPRNRVQRGQGGLEVKASRYEGGWQAHGPRAGWFCVVQFAFDDDEDKAIQNREPTRVRAVMLAEVTEDDWSWQPAQPGRIRSGTASIKPGGVGKLRGGAVWVEPSYELRHLQLLQSTRTAVLMQQREAIVTSVLAGATDPLRATDIAERLAQAHGIDDPATLVARITATLSVLRKAGTVENAPRGYWRLVED